MTSSVGILDLLPSFSLICGGATTGVETVVSLLRLLSARLLCGGVGGRLVRLEIVFHSD